MGVILAQAQFERILWLERKRTVRSGSQFVLLLLESERPLRTPPKDRLLDRIDAALARSTRETDVRGWYREDSTLGVIFTEVDDANGPTVVALLRRRIETALRESLAFEQIKPLRLSFHIFPGIPDPEEETSDSPLGEELAISNGNAPPRIAKTFIGIAGVLLALIASIPCS
jgi:hypothetical protein